MTTPNVLPAGFTGTVKDFTLAKSDQTGSLRIVAGAVSVPSGTTVNSFVGLVPFRRGARFLLNDKSVHCADIGGASTTANLGYIYDQDTVFTNDADAFASLATAPASGGFIVLDEIVGLTFVAEADGWITVQIAGANTDNTGNITYNFGVSYDTRG